METTHTRIYKTDNEKIKKLAAENGCTNVAMINKILQWYMVKNQQKEEK